MFRLLYADGNRLGQLRRKSKQGHGSREGYRVNRGRYEASTTESLQFLNFAESPSYRPPRIVGRESLSFAPSR